MPITTYLNEWQKHKIIENAELRLLLKELNKLDGNKWVICEYTGAKGFLWNRKEYKYYNLLLDYSGDGIEYQIINFYKESAEFESSTEVSADMLSAYLYGAIGVLDQRNRDAN